MPVFLFDTEAAADDDAMRERYRLAVKANTEHDAFQKALRLTSRRWRKHRRWASLGVLTATRVAREYELVGMD